MWRKKKEGGISARDGEVQARGTAAEKDIMARQEKEHIYPCLLWCITSLSFPGKKKKGAVADEWLRSQEKNRAELAPEGPRGENDYFLAKWFWLELHLNHVGDGTLNQYSNTGATLWLNSFKVTLLTLSRPEFLDLVGLSHPGPSHYTWTLIVIAANVIMCDVFLQFQNLSRVIIFL